MTRIATLRNTLSLMTMCFSLSAQPQPGCKEEGSQFITSQIIALRAQIGGLLVEWHDRRAAEFTRELEALRGQQDTLDKEERQLKQQISDVEAQLAAPGTEEMAKTELQAIRSQLIGEATEKLRSDRAALEHRSTETAGRLAQEKQRYEQARGWIRQSPGTLSSP